MTKGSPGDSLDWISFGFASELVSIKWYYEEIPNIFSNRFTVRSPKRRNCVQKKCKSIHSYLPKVLVLVLIALFQSNDVGEFRIHNRCTRNSHFVALFYISMDPLDGVEEIQGGHRPKGYCILTTFKVLESL